MFLVIRDQGYEGYFPQELVKTEAELQQLLLDQSTVVYGAYEILRQYSEDEINALRASAENTRVELIKSALAKLTPEEQDALGV